MSLRFPLSLAVGAALAASATTPILADDDEVPFAVAEIFFELNDTDGDLGIHALIDGDEWRRLTIEDVRERKMLAVNVKGRLRRQGLTEIFFESAEPTFDELPPETFFGRFPEGTYEVEGIRLDGAEMESETNITHLIPAPPQAYVNDVPAVADCDEDEIPVFEAEGLVISWDPVTRSHPDLGRTNRPIQVVNYELVVEVDDTPYKGSVILPPNVTSVEVPEDLLALAEEFKYEVLVREASFNQTAVESCFAVE